MAVLALIFGTAYVGLVISAVEAMMELKEAGAINALDEHAQNIEPITDMALIRRSTSV